MKKIFSIFVAMIIAIGISYAQPVEKLRFKDVLNNRFADNWELAVDGGGVYTAWNKFGFKQDKFSKNVGWTADVTATKWFNPIVGARVQVPFGQHRVCCGPAVDKAWVMNPHVDAVVNLSNWIGGYKEDRIYYAKLFAGAGANITDIGDGANAGMMATAGLINTFRVSPKFDVNVELRGHVMEQDDMMRYAAHRPGKVGQHYNATVGLAYRFGKRDWHRGVPHEVAEKHLAMIHQLHKDLDHERAHNKRLTDRIRKYDEAVRKLAHDNKMLHEQIKNHRCDNPVVTTSTVFFDFDSAKLCDRSKVSLDLLAEVIKNSPEKQVFTIAGHADSKTGSAKHNLKLSEKRATAVYDYLVSKGVAKEKLNIVAVGGVDTFKVQHTNRVAIIK